MNRKIFRLLAVAILAGAVGTWWFTGANRGWTKTSVAQEKTDDVTGISYREYQKRFVPGVDFLGAAALGAGVLAAASFLFRKKQTYNPNQ